MAIYSPSADYFEVIPPSSYTQFACSEGAHQCHVLSTSLLATATRRQLRFAQPSATLGQRLAGAPPLDPLASALCASARLAIRYAGSLPLFESRLVCVECQDILKCIEFSCHPFFCFYFLRPTYRDGRAQPTTTYPFIFFVLSAILLLFLQKIMFFRRRICDSISPSYPLPRDSDLSQPPPGS